LMVPIIPVSHFQSPLPNQSRSSFTDLEQMKGRVDLDTTMVSKQSAQDRYVTQIAKYSDMSVCRFKK